MRTKIRLTASIFCLLIAAFCVIGLASCGGSEPCSHSWGKWKVTAEATCVASGRQERTCQKCGETEVGSVPMTAHKPVADDGDCTTAVICSICGDTITEAKAKHTGGSATCKEKAKCAVCGKEYGELGNHVPNADDGDCTTAITCSLCGDVTTEAKANHTGGSATCKEKAKCTVCGKEYGELAKHIPNADDGDCTTAVTCSVCGDVTTDAKVNHVGGSATCKEKAKCDNCGKEYGELAKHIPNADDGDCTTAVTCSVCGNIAIPANTHTGGTATCKALAKCSACGEEYGDFAPHTPVADDGDCTTAIACSVCGGVATEAKPAHTGGTATCAKKAECDACGKQYGELKAHTPNEDDGDCTTAITCSACGATTTEAKPAHTGGAATCEHKAKCAVCGKEYGELAEHDGEKIWMKYPKEHCLAYSCCYKQISSPEKHVFVDGACEICGFVPFTTVDSPEARPGATQVKFAVSIVGNPGILGLMISVEYDDAVLTMTKAQSGNALNALTFTSPSKLDSGCKFLWDGEKIEPADVKDGELLILTFDVSSSAAEGVYDIILNITAVDNDLNPIVLNIEGGMIMVKGNI